MIKVMEEDGKKPNNKLTKNDDPDFAFYDEKINGNAWQTQIEPEKEDIENFIRALALCHTVNPEWKKDANGKETDEIKYNAASPDDGALVKACKNFGYKLTERKMLSGNKARITIEVATPTGEVEEQQWVVLETIDFTSTRKRMSIIAQCPKGKIYLVMKGADNYIRARLHDVADAAKVEEENTKAVKAAGDDKAKLEEHPITITQRQVDNFASQGLRTLFVAQRTVEQKEFDAWKVKYDKSLEDKATEE